MNASQACHIGGYIVSSLSQTLCLGEHGPRIRHGLRHFQLVIYLYLSELKVRLYFREQ